MISQVSDEVVEASVQPYLPEHLIKNLLIHVGDDVWK